jgi:hypothetical protein
MIVSEDWEDVNICRVCRGAGVEESEDQVSTCKSEK